MIYDVVETMYSVALTYFDSDLATLCAAKSVTAPATTKLYKHQQAGVFVDFKDAIPGLGIDALRATTQMKGQTNRDATATGIYDYVVRGTDPALVAKQGALAAEALCKVIDRLSGVDTIEGAGHRDGSIHVELGPALQETEADAAGVARYIRQATVTFEIDDRDIGL